MAGERESYRRILAATAVMGGATVIAIAIGIVRTKIFALAIGPVGIGLVGLFTSIMATAAAVGSMGLGFSGVRQIAADEKNRAVARTALWLAIWPLAMVTALVLWLGRHEIGRWVIGNDGHALGVGLMGIAAAFAIVAVGQTAVIQGMGRVGDVARVRVRGALLSLLIGVPAVLYAGALGIALAVIAIPLGNLLAALPYRPRPEPRSGQISRQRIIGEWRQLLTLGATLMLTSTLAAGILVVVRTIVIRHDGLEAAGLYQAAYAISAMNASLVLSAMATDYFPRLSGAQADRAVSATLVNQQLHAALLLASPILLGVAALAPLVLELLYSGAFTAAADMLRWQLVGELLKLPGWALGFLLVARVEKSRFLLVESGFAVAYVTLTLVLLPVAGLAGVGMAYAAAYLVYSLLLIAICSRGQAVSVSRENRLHLGLVGAALIGVSVFGAKLPWLAAALGVIAAAVAGWHTLRHLNEIRRSPTAAPPPTPGEDFQPV